MSKNLTEQLPLIGGLIVILGVFKLNLYYSNFSVPIQYFISISEVTATVAGDLLKFLLFLVALKSMELMYYDMRPTKTISLTGPQVIWFRALMILINAGLIIWSLFDKPFYLRIINYSLQFCFFFFAFAETNSFKAIYLKYNSFAFVVIFFMSSLLIISLSTAVEIRAVTAGKYKGTRIITDDSTFTSTDKNYYIGQSEKYIFIYNDSNDCTIIPNSDVKRIDFKR